MRALVIECNPEYSTSSEDKRHFFPGWLYSPSNLTDVYKESDSSFVYHSQDELGGMALQGHFTTYSGGGYVAHLGEEEEDARETINQLKQNDWFNLYTRALIVEFTLYNAGANLFNNIQLIFETPSTGGALIKYNVETFRVYTNVGNTRVASMICEAVVLGLFIYYLALVITNIAKTGKSYILRSVNWFDLIHVILGVTVVVLYISKYSLTSAALEDVFSAKGEVIVKLLTV